MKRLQWLILYRGSGILKWSFNENEFRDGMHRTNKRDKFAGAKWTEK